MRKLFTPFTLKNVTLKNRIVMSSMCMYSCMNEDGKVTNWHRVHYTSRAVGQVGLIMFEATAVTPQGRISAQDLGIWNDDQVEGLKETVELVHEHGAKAGIQLAHAGRKAKVDGPIFAPSSLPFQEGGKTPQEMSQTDIKETIEAFQEGARRAKEAGFDIIEIHGAHGYLINSFLTPLTNQREDEYGGDEKRRYQFLKETIEAVQEVWEGPLFVRISANDYHPQGNTIEQYVTYARLMKEQGVDFIDCSSGGVLPVKINPYPGYQVSYAEEIKHKAHIATGAVGLITEGVQAEEILQNERADLVFLARELLRNPYWPRLAAAQLNVDIESPRQYDRGW